MANVSLQASSLRDAANKMKDAADRLETSLQSIDSIVAETSGVWDDINSKKYLSRYEELKQEFPAFKNEVRSYGDFLDKVVDAYQRDFIEPVAGSVNGTN